jgi:hypothetical protein
MSNGKAVVLDTDSDSDLSEIPALDFGEGTKDIPPVKTATPIRRSKRTSEKDDDTLRKPQKRGKSKQFDLLVETAQRNIEIEKAIQAHKADLEKDLGASAAAGFTFTEQVLGQAVRDDDDPDQARRLFLAMQRTNATQTESVFHFFTDTSDSLTAPAGFPSDSLPNHRWTASFQGHYTLYLHQPVTNTFQDPSSRDQAFMTGFAHQVFRMQELPEELALWMVDQSTLLLGMA